MITPLLWAIHFRRRPSSSSERSPIAKEITTGVATPIDRDQGEDRPGDGLLPRRRTGTRDGSGTRDDEQQVLRVEARDDDPGDEGP